MPEDKLLRVDDVVKITSISRAQIYRYIKAGIFPAPTKLSKKLTVWKASTVQNWMAQHVN